MSDNDRPKIACEDKPFVEWFRKPWQERLAFIEQMVREISLETDPHKLVRYYVDRMQEIFPAHARLAISRRDLEYPFVRVTRTELNRKLNINPWKQRDRLPLLRGGILAELIYNEKAVIIDDLQLASDDPAREYLEGIKSIVALPLFDGGKSLNMALLGRKDQGFCWDFMPEHLWISNLFGRATANLVLKEQLHEAYQMVERELLVVADIQRSLLPVELPQIPGLDIAAYYQTSRHAGGDYYDFFPLSNGKLGILIADVSGHGTPAAVVMAVTHSIAHTHDGDPDPPSKLLNFINRHLAARYTTSNGTFVTAFYGIYDPATRDLVFANAGHNPPRLKRGRGGPNGIIESLANLPLGIDAAEQYTDSVQRLTPGDILVLYTDGITEARNDQHELFGADQLDEAINHAGNSSQQLIDETVARVDAFTGHKPPGDDRTLLVIQVS